MSLSELTFLLVLAAAYYISGFVFKKQINRGIEWVAMRVVLLWERFEKKKETMYFINEPEPLTPAQAQKLFASLLPRREITVEGIETMSPEGKKSLYRSLNLIKHYSNTHGEVYHLRLKQ